MHFCPCMWMCILWAMILLATILASCSLFYSRCCNSNIERQMKRLLSLSASSPPPTTTRVQHNIVQLTDSAMQWIFVFSRWLCEERSTYHFWILNLDQASKWSEVHLYFRLCMVLFHFQLFFLSFTPISCVSLHTSKRHMYVVLHYDVCAQSRSRYIQSKFI